MYLYHMEVKKAYKIWGERDWGSFGTMIVWAFSEAQAIEMYHNCFLLKSYIVDCEQVFVKPKLTKVIWVKPI